MLKKILSKLAYLAVMACLGFAIYYYFLAPKHLENSTNNDYKNLSTQALFSATLPNENEVNQALAQYKGKIIVLNFWATWCPPCRDEMPELSQLHLSYQNKNVVVLGIGIDEAHAVKSFIQSNAVSYPLFVSENEGMALNSSLGNSQGVLPYTVIIDTNGDVKDTFYGRLNMTLLTSSIERLIKP
jgi:peroxiredoxin